ncbi:MAG: 1-(5-phosphoribosyl)-5-[(5-phosphoribosylamino)methylideneamino]imidazole-4-carboxamide isomerase [Pygmaiobacter massiliensis]|nr:1-(5-phosphoribosyl)-5-[(5-phosphoribosylamino)methylideneamino]imidazole-4-carboxamide isomerase [Pygmaiobacter massiliensis]
MKLFPAIDLLGAQAVRLLQGDYNKVTVYSPDPVQVACSFAQKGAKYLHLVDLDGARAGECENFETIRAIIKATGMYCEVGGGIRTEERVKAYLDLGAKRVILGTAALKDPDFLARMVARYGEAIAVGVDAKNGYVATDGWKQVSAQESFAFCETLCQMGVKTVIYTDIAKDGGLSGTNLAAYQKLVTIQGLNITASGGITTTTELLALKQMGVDAAILGKALYAGALRLEDAVACLEEGGTA